MVYEQRTLQQHHLLLRPLGARFVRVHVGLERVGLVEPPPADGANVAFLTPMTLHV